MGRALFTAICVLVSSSGVFAAAGCSAGGGTDGAGAGSSNAGAAGTTAGSGGASAGASGALGAGSGGSSAGASSGGSAGSLPGGAGSGGVDTAGTGGGASGGGSGGNQGPCSAPGLRFCDDFEKAGSALDSQVWSTDRIGDGTVSVDAAAPAHSGSRSVRVEGTGYQTFFTLKGSPAFPAPNGRLHLRVFIRLSQAMTVGHNTYFKSGMAATTSSEHETRIGVQQRMLMINQPAGDRGFLSNVDFYTDGGMLGAVFQPMTWHCVEVLNDAPRSEIQVWVDDQDVPDLHRTDWQQDPFDAYRFGFESYAGPAETIWYDDIAIGTERIGCR